MCRRQPGIGESLSLMGTCILELRTLCLLAIGRLCEKCDGKWCVSRSRCWSLFDACCSPVCDSYVRPETLVRICDECNFGTYGGRCIICGSPGERGSLSFSRALVCSRFEPPTFPHSPPLFGSFVSHLVITLLSLVGFFPRLP